MKRYFLTLFFIIALSNFNNAIAQGGINVKFIQIDSLDLSYLNKEVKIDFKNTINTHKDSLFTLKDLWTSHTKITIDNKLIEITEYNGRGPDYWYFDEAFLELKNYKPNLVFRVSKSIIKEVTKESVNFQWTIEPYYEKGNNATRIKPEIKNIWIPKELINGILIRT